MLSVLDALRDLVDAVAAVETTPGRKPIEVGLTPAAFEALSKDLGPLRHAEGVHLIQTGISGSSIVVHKLGAGVHGRQENPPA